MESLDGNRSAPVTLTLDGKKLGTLGVSFSYICVGHGGQVLTTRLWNCFRPTVTALGQPTAFAASAGKQTLRLAAEGDAKTLWHSFIITNDLGFEPEGIVDFRAEPEGK